MCQDLDEGEVRAAVRAFDEEHEVEQDEAEAEWAEEAAAAAMAAAGTGPRAGAVTSRQQLLRDGYALLRQPKEDEDEEGAEGGLGGRGGTTEGGRATRREGALRSVVRDGRGRVVEVEGRHLSILEASSWRCHNSQPLAPAGPLAGHTAPVMCSWRERRAAQGPMGG